MERFHDKKIYVANGEKYIWTLKNEFYFSCKKKKEEELDFKVVYIKHLLYFLFFKIFGSDKLHKRFDESACICQLCTLASILVQPSIPAQ